MPVGERVDEHTHEDEDQICIVVSGTVGGTVGDREVLLTDGSVCFFPRGVPHTLWNEGDDVARLVDIYTPAGFEKMFELAGAAGRQQS